MIIVLGKQGPAPTGAVEVDTTSRSTSWSRGLSPFLLGPCPLWGGHVAKNVENAWQYSKVYSQHIHLRRPEDPPELHIHDNDIVVELDKWLPWAMAGWANPRAVRYPMGKGGPPPLFSYWDGMRFGYVEARQRIYIPLYWNAVAETPAFYQLMGTAHSARAQGWDLVLRDFDGYDWRAAGLPNLEAVVTSAGRKMGHAFVLAMMLKVAGLE